MSRAEALGFLLEPGPWRSGVLGVTLDALEGSAADGSSVALGVQDPAHTQLWTDAVAQFMPVAGGLAVVPAAQVLRQGAVVVLSEEDPEMLGELDLEPHHTAGGALVAVTEWSVLAQTVLIDEPTATSLLARRDRIQESLPGVHPMCALALAVAGDPRARDGWAEAVRVILRLAPAKLARNEELMAVAVGAVRIEVGVAAAWDWQSALTGPVILGPGEEFALPADEPRWSVAVRCPGAVGLVGVEVDVVAYLLDWDRQGRSSDFVYYNAPGIEGEAVRLIVESPTSQGLEIDLGRVPDGRMQIVIAASIDGPATFRELGPIEISATGSGGTVVQANLRSDHTASAMVLAHLTDYVEGWRIEAVELAHPGGLSGLTQDFGIGVTS